MSGAEFTPGPWDVKHEIDEEGFHSFWVNTSFDSTVAKCYNPQTALMVASIPEMYEALKLYVEFESQLVLDNGAWGNADGLPKFTQGLLDKWMEIQAKRNEVLNKIEGEI